MWFQFVVGSFLAGFPPSTENQHSKIQFHQDRGPARKLAMLEVASFLNIVYIYLIDYLLICLFVCLFI